MTSSPHETADLQPKQEPDETDGDYPANVEGTGSARSDEPTLDEPNGR